MLPSMADTLNVRKQVTGMKYSPKKKSGSDILMSASLRTRPKKKRISRWSVCWCGRVPRRLTRMDRREDGERDEEDEKDVEALREAALEDVPVRDAVVAGGRLHGPVLLFGAFALQFVVPVESLKDPTRPRDQSQTTITKQ